MSHRASELRRWFVRPRIVLPLFALGALLVFPRAIPHEITLHHRVPASCPAAVVVEISRSDAVVRRFEQHLAGESEVVHAMKLPDTTLHANVWLECDDGRATQTIVHPIVVDRSGRIDFDLSATCPCPRT